MNALVTYTTPYQYHERGSITLILNEDAALLTLLSIDYIVESRFDVVFLYESYTPLQVVSYAHIIIHGSVSFTN